MNTVKMTAKTDMTPQSLTTCEVAPDGNTIVIHFTDVQGAAAQIRLSLNQVGGLAMTLPGVITQALRVRYGDHSLKYAYPLASWTVERSSDPRTGMVTLCTTDGFSVCFSMQRELRHELADALASDGPGRLPMPVN